MNYADNEMIYQRNQIAGSLISAHVELPVSKEIQQHHFFSTICSTHKTHFLLRLSTAISNRGISMQ